MTGFDSSILRQVEITVMAICVKMKTMMSCMMNVFINVIFLIEHLMEFMKVQELNSFQQQETWLYLLCHLYFVLLQLFYLYYYLNYTINVAGGKQNQTIRWEKYQIIRHEYNGTNGSKLGAT